MHTSTTSKHFQEAGTLFLQRVNLHRLRGRLCYLFLRYLADMPTPVPRHHMEVVHDMEALLLFLEVAEMEQQLQKKAQQHKSQAHRPRSKKAGR